MANSTKRSSTKSSSNVLLFGSMNYKLMILGALLITAGFLLMSGGVQSYQEKQTLPKPLILRFTVCSASFLLQSLLF